MAHHAHELVGGAARAAGPASARLREACQRTGVLGFEEFLTLALYDPEVGYYGSGRARVGERGGDFFTNVSVGPIYGEILAGQIVEVWQALDCPQPFTVIEQGAHEGVLLADVLRVLDTVPGLCEAWRARVIEPLDEARRRQEETLAPWQDRVAWVRSPRENPVPHGVHFSNELLDALPFALVVFRDGRWSERVVTWRGEGFCWEERALDQRLQAAMAHWPQPPGSPFLAEVRPALSAWIEQVGEGLHAGMILVCDYGYPVEGFFQPTRREGTLWCYQNHRRDADPLDQPGAKDITAHVDFTALERAAAAAGWATLGCTDQHHFLVGASEEWLRSLDGKSLTPTEQRRLRSWRRLMHPESMGTQFRFWVGGRGLPAGWKPSGLRYARVG